MVAYDVASSSSVEIPATVRNVLEAARQRAAITEKESAG